MKFKKIIYFSLIFFQPFIGFSQIKKDTTNFKCVKLNLTSFFEPFPLYRISYESSLNKLFNIENEIGFYTKYAPSIGNTGIGFLDRFPKNIYNLYGLRLKSEVKYYTSKKKQNEGFYISSSISWSYYNIIGDFPNNSGLDQYFYNGDYLHKYKHIVTFQQKFGFQDKDNDSQFLTDFYWGIGIRYFYQRYITNSYPKYYGFLDKPIIPTFICGVKLGYIIKNLH